MNRMVFEDIKHRAAKDVFDGTGTNGATCSTTQPRNWIEKAIGKQWMSQPIRIGKNGGRDVYTIDWIDGTSGDYYIDYDYELIEVFSR